MLILVSYTLIDVIKLSNGDRIMKLRNPWGKGEFNGEYADESPIWTEKLKKEAGWLSVRDDGIFFMKIEDFVKYFDQAYACHYRENYILSSMKDVNSCNFACYQFNISKPADYYFGVSQPDMNMMPESHKYGKQS